MKLVTTRINSTHSLISSDAYQSKDHLHFCGMSATEMRGVTLEIEIQIEIKSYHKSTNLSQSFIQFVELN